MFGCHQCNPPKSIPHLLFDVVERCYRQFLWPISFLFGKIAHTNTFALCGSLVLVGSLWLYATTFFSSVSRHSTRPMRDVRVLYAYMQHTGVAAPYHHHHHTTPYSRRHLCNNIQFPISFIANAICQSVHQTHIQQKKMLIKRVITGIQWQTSHFISINSRLH